MDARLAAPGPLDVPGTLARFRLWGEDPANRLSRGVFRRAIKVGAAWRGWELRWAGGPDDPRLTVSVPGARSARVVDLALGEARRVCGLELDLGGFYAASKTDPVLAGLAPRLYGLRPTLAPSGFEMLVGAITAQQVSLAVAFAVRARVVRRYGVPVEISGETVWAFPEPAAMLASGRVWRLEDVEAFARDRARRKGRRIRR